MREHQKAVENGAINYVSVSQIQTHHACARKWYFKYVAGLPDKPPSVGQQRGSQGHKALEHYLTGAEGALTGLEGLAVNQNLLPAPGGNFFTEHRIDMVVADVPLLGYIDLLNATKLPKSLKVTDFKFKSDIDKWGTHPAELVDPDCDAGIQTVTYGVYAWDLYPEAEALTLEHLQFQTKGRPQVVSAQAELRGTDGHKQLTKAFETVTSYVEGMKLTVLAENGFKVEPNLDSCSDFGGCAYMDKCHNSMSKLQLALEGKLGRTTPTEKGAANMGLMDSIPKVGIVAQPVAPAPAAVLPPDAPKSNPALAAKVDTLPASPSGKVIWETPLEQPAAPPVAITEKEVEGKPTPLADAMQAAPIIKRGRGRPRKEEAPAAPAAPPSLDERPKNPGTLHLYFGCFPVGVKTDTLASYVQALQCHIIKVAQLSYSDIRMATDSALGFGKWKAYLGQEAIAKPPEPGHYVVFRGDERIEVVAEALAGVLGAGQVVRGGG